MRLPIAIRGLFNSEAENKTPQGRAYSNQNTTVDDGNAHTGNRYVNVGQRPNPLAGDVCFGEGYGKFDCNETQALTITGTTPTSGTVVLQWNGHNAAAVNWNAAATDVQTALAGLSDFDDGEIICSGGPWPNEPIYASFHGRYGAKSEPLIVLHTNGLNTGTVTISEQAAGGTAEVYLVVVQPNGAGTATIYKVTSSDGFNTTTWTSVGTGLTASDWFFQQFEDKIYAANATDGLTYFQLGGIWAGALGIPGIQNPNVLPIGFNIFNGGSTSWTTGGNATFGTFVGWGSDPTITISGTNLNIKLNAALVNADVSFTITLAAVMDLSTQDLYLLRVNSNPATEVLVPGSFLLDFVNNDGTPLTMTPPFANKGKITALTGQALYERKFHMGSSGPRSKRVNILKIDVTLHVTKGANGNSIHMILGQLDTWPNDSMDTLDINAGPVVKRIQYGYSYLQAATGIESKMSPIANSDAVPADTSSGSHVAIRVPYSTALLNTDFVVIYRRGRDGIMRRIGLISNVAAGGTTNFTDKNMVDEIDGYAPFPVIHLPGGFLPTNLGIWNQCLVAASDRKAWISSVGKPLIFAPDPENNTAPQLDPTDPEIGRTVFMSRQRDEQVLGIVGQDGLYLSGLFSGYAMVDGDAPNSLSPPRPLPGSRGCLGTRAGYALSAGALFPARSGAWYYSVSPGFQGLVGATTFDEEELSKEIRTSWANVFGAGASGCVSVVFNEETYVWNAKQYIKWTRNKHIEQGTFADSVKAAIANQANGLIFATSTGQLMKIVATAVTDNGAVVPWSIATGLIEMERSRFESLEVKYVGSPRILVEWWDGNSGHDTQPFDLISDTGSQLNFYIAKHVMIGVRFRITISGVGGDSVEELTLVGPGVIDGGRGN